MSKMLKKNSLFGQRPLLAMSLAASVMAFGCTTDRTLGDGDLGGRSGVPAAPTSGVTSGSETEPTPTLPPPMTSSYSRPYSESGALPKVARSVRRLSADEAAMLMAEHKPQYRVLGPVSPALSGNVYHSANLVTGQSQYLTSTYSPSLTSGAIGAIVNDVGSAVTNTSPITGSLAVGTPVSTATGTSAPLTIGSTPVATANQTVGNGGAPVFASGAATGIAASTLGATTIVPTFATPTNAATTATPGAFAASTLTPTNAAIGTTPGAFAAPTLTPTNAAVDLTGRTIGNAATPLPSMQRTTTSTTASTTATRSRTAARSTTARATTTTTRAVTATAPLRIVSGAQGVTITNQQ